MFQEQTFSTAKGKRHLVTTAEVGTPLVLMHGVTRRWQCYLSIIPALAPRWTVHAFDFRGHGKSERVPNGYRVIDYAEDGVSLLRDRLQCPVVLYGHSLGAMVVAHVASQVPDLVQAVIMEDPPFRTMGSRILQTPFQSYFQAVASLLEQERSIQELSHELAKLTFDNPQTRETFQLGKVRASTALRFMARCLLDVDPTVFEPIVQGRWLEGYDLQQIFSAIRCPTLLLQADPSAGGVLVNEDVDEVKQHSLDCTHVRLSGVGHLIHLTHTPTLLQHVIPFLESLGFGE